MSAHILLLLAFFTLSICYFFYNCYLKRRHLPPGPMPLPLFGNVFDFVLDPPGYAPLLKWQKRYGNVFTYWTIDVPIVAICDYKMMQETIVKDGDTYADRYQFSNFAKIYYDEKYMGIINANDQYWREQRRFALHTLRNFGVGKNLMQEKILDEVEHVIKNLNSAIASSKETTIIVDIADYLDNCVGSIINNLLFGYRFDEDKLHEYRRMKVLIDTNLTLCTSPFATLPMLVPVLRNIPIINSKYNEFMRNRNSLFEFIEIQISEHEKLPRNKDYTDEASDFVFAFFKEIEQRKNKSSDENHSFVYVCMYLNHYFLNLSRKQLISVCIDLWFAGFDTSTTTIKWAFVYMLNNNEVQHRIHVEMDEHIGRDRLIEMADRQQLPYTCAVLNEVQRLANILPLNITRKTNRDVTIGNYHIGKGTAVMPLISVVHLDDRIFPDPQRFDPTRFLDDNGQLKKVDQLIPFSVGKRQCPGESLARAELFLVFANLLHKFKFDTESPNGGPPSLDKQFSAVVHPQPFRCRVTIRK